MCKFVDYISFGENLLKNFKKTQWHSIKYKEKQNSSQNVNNKKITRTFTVKIPNENLCKIFILIIEKIIMALGLEQKVLYLTC